MFTLEVSIAVFADFAFSCGLASTIHIAFFCFGFQFQNLDAAIRANFPPDLKKLFNEEGVWRNNMKRQIGSDRPQRKRSKTKR